MGVANVVARGAVMDPPGLVRRRPLGLWRSLSAVAGMLLVAGVLAGCGGAADPTRVGEVIPVSDRQPAPLLQGPLLGGGAFDASETAGVVTVVNFWGSWCGPCRVEMPEFEQVAQANGEVQFVGINVRDQEDLAEAFTEVRGITYPSISDPAGELLSDFSSFPVTQTPSTVLIDDSGNVAATYLGAVSAAELQRGLDQLT